MACAVLSLSGTKSAPLQLNFALTGLDANTLAGGLHIHSGTSCSTEQTQGGHDYDTSVTVVDPWGPNTVYSTDSTKRGKGSFIVFNTGRSLMDVLGKVVVVHDSRGIRKACGVISAADALSSGMLATSADYDPRTVTTDGRMDNSCLTAGDRGDPETALSGTPATCVEAAMIGNSARLPGPSNHSHGQGIDYEGKGYTSGAIEDAFLTLNGPNSILGRSIVVHENGRRVGACVIGRAYDLDSHDSVKTPKVVPSERAEGAKCVLQSTGALSPPATVARLQTWPGVAKSDDVLTTSSGTRALPRGEAVLSETNLLQAADFENMGTGGVELDTKSKVWLGQTGDDVTLYYALKYSNAGAGVTGKNYGVHVHTGTDCATAQTQGGHMWLPRSETDPWAGAASPYTYVLSGEAVTDAAYGSFVIKGGAGYTMADMVGRVVVIHVDAARVACAKLSYAPGIALTYDISGGVMPGVKGAMHVSKIAAKTCTAPDSAQRVNMFTSEDAVKGEWNDYWRAISYVADAGGRARGVAVVPSTFSAYDAQGATVVFYRGLDHSDSVATSEEGPIACGDLAWEYGTGAGPASFRGGAQANVGRAGGESAGEIGGYVTLENSRATGGKTRVSWHVTGLEAKSKHKWHVHNFGDVTPNTGGMRTGGHFVGVDPSIGSSDPAAAAKWQAEGGEVGYVGNGAPYPAGPASVLSADATGVSEGEIMDDYITLSGPNSVIGRSIVIHGMRRNAAGNWVSGRAAMCTIGRADPESDSSGGKHHPASASSTGGVFFTSISSYPGYAGPLKDSITGIVTVGQLDRETVLLGYELGGLGTGRGDIGVVDGIHIHAGTSCDTSEEGACGRGLPPLPQVLVVFGVVCLL